MFSFKGILRFSSVFILYFSIVLVAFVFWGSDEEYNTNQMIARGFISERSVFFDVHDPSAKTAKYLNYVINEDGTFQNLGNVDIDFNTNEVDMTPYEGEDPDYKITNDVLENGLTQIETILSSGGDDYLAAVHTGTGRGVFYKGDAIIPPVIEGRFISEEECLIREPLAVVGKEYKKDIYSENGKNFIDYLGKKYEVIGIVGMDQDSTLDSLVFVNLGSMDPDVQLQGRLYLDTEKNIKRIYDTLDRTSYAVYGYGLDEYARPETMIDIVSNGLYLKTYLKVLTLLMASFLYVSILIQSIGINKMTIAVMKTVGIRYRRMYMKVNLPVFIIACVGMVLGIVTDFIMIKCHVFDLNMGDTVRALLVISCSALVLFFIWAMIVVIHNNRLNPGDCLRDL